jgi:hypothetical protein
MANIFESNPKTDSLMIVGLGGFVADSYQGSSAFSKWLIFEAPQERRHACAPSYFLGMARGKCLA